MRRVPERLTGNSLYGQIFNTKTVVPAQAGTHTPQLFGSSHSGKVIC